MSEGERDWKLVRGLLAQEADPPRYLGKYVLRRRIAQGGMGIVWEAEDGELKRRVALKVLKGSGSPEELARFQREATIAAQLRHPNIITIHEVGAASGVSGDPVPFIAMDFVDGSTLAEVLADRKKRDRADLLRMVEDVARAVGYAHSRGVIHRDLKPANVLVDRSGRVVLTDFGLARAETLHTRLTHSNEVMGTPQYMAPEQVEGKTREIDERTDVYALGVILYEILTGRPPFDARTAAHLYQQILKDEPQRPSSTNRLIEADLEVICLKALEKERHRRYPGATDFAEDLARFRQGEPILGRPPSWGYRLHKRLARRRSMIGWGGTAILLATVAAIFGIRWARRDATRNEKLAELRAAEAERYRRVQEEKIKPLLVRMSQARPMLYVEGSDVARMISGIEVALEELEVLTKNPETARFAEVWTMLGMGRYFVGDSTRAEQALLQAENLDAADLRISYYLGRIYLERAMEALLAPALTNRPSPGEIKLWSEKAIVYLERGGSGGLGTDEIDLDVAQAYLAMSRGNLQEAKRLSEEGRARFGRVPGTEEYSIVWAYTHVGAEGVLACDEAIARRPHFAWGYFLRGVHRSAQKQWEAGIADLDKAIAFNPRHSGAYVSRGIARYWRAEYDRAVEDFDRALALRPGYARALFARGLARKAAGDKDLAIADFTEALRIDPDNAESYYDRGCVRLEKGEAEEAAHDFSESLRLDPGNADAHVNRALARRKLGDLDGALEDRNEVVRIQPNSDDAYHQRGHAWFDKKERERAIADFNRSLDLRPRANEALYCRGMAKGGGGDIAGAIADVEKALEEMPAHWAKRAEAEEMLRKLKKQRP